MRDGASGQTISEIRRDLAAAYRLISLEGMDDGIYTHISARLPRDRGANNASCSILMGCALTRSPQPIWLLSMKPGL